MAILYVSSRGDDSDGLTWATAFNQIITAFTALTGAQDDTVIIDDEEHNQTSELSTRFGTKTGGTLFLQSRSENPFICSISGVPSIPAGNFYLLRNDETITGNPALNIKGIKFKDHYRSDSLPIIFNSNTSDFTIENCILDNLQLTASAAACNGIVRQEGITSKAFTIDGLVVTNCSVDFSLSPSGNEGALFSSSTEGAAIGSFANISVDQFSVVSGSTHQVNGLCYFKGPQAWDGVNHFSNISFIMSSDSYGLIKIETVTGYENSITGEMMIDAVNSPISSPGDNKGLINVSSFDSLTIDAIFEAQNCVSSGTQDNAIISSLVGNAQLFISGDISIHDNSSSIATGLIVNLANQFTLSNAEIYNNTAGGGGIALVSFGAEVTIYNCFIHDNIATTFGGAIFCLNLAALTSHTRIHNCTFFNNDCLVANQGDGIYILSPAINYNLQIDNCIFWNQIDDDEIRVGAGSNPVELIVTNNDIIGGESAVTGATVYQKNIDLDPLFNADFTLSDLSPCIGIGIRWWPYTMSNPIDLNGHYFWDAYVDIGAYSTWDGHYRRVPASPRFPTNRFPIN